MHKFVDNQNKLLMQYLLTTPRYSFLQSNLSHQEFHDISDLEAFIEPTKITNIQNIMNHWSYRNKKNPFTYNIIIYS